ncbi:YciI family protein [Microlunatus speluncae]|uniref:YciI family protein n=1 Tax=Microlunatus speluncae TaxID=2594267 RepID=UPI0012668316|nr:YciI family protein [Microlunatus speluncae]
MEFFCYHRDRAGSAVLRAQLLEDHWSYLDRYSAAMIARGPVLADDNETAIGSVHLLDLPDPATARDFVFDEPNYRAGVYRDVMLRRWHNTLGRTMWEFPAGYTDHNRYLVLGLGPDPESEPIPPDRRDALIAHGPLLADDGTTQLGTIALTEAPDAEAARLVLTPGRYAELEVHRWDYGGRPGE